MLPSPPSVSPAPSAPFRSSPSCPPLCAAKLSWRSPITFLLTSVALRCTMSPVPRLPGRFNPMKRLQSLLSALAILALGFLIVGAIVFLLVDAILGGAL